MPEETKPQNQNEQNSSDEVIDLAGIVRDIDLTPTSFAVSQAAAERGPLHAEELGADQLDALLLTESPELAAEMEAIREVGAVSSDNDIKPVEQEDAAARAALHGHSKMTFRERARFQILKLMGLLTAGKYLAKRAAVDFKGVLRELAIRAKFKLIAGLTNRKAELGHGFGWLKSRSTSQKLSLLFSIVALAALIFIAARSMNGPLLPETEKVWVASFAEVADGVFTYDPAGAFEDFNDPLLHPEFVILIERTVVNLARSADASDRSNPMAAFELYLQTDNQDAAIEIKDRSVEIKDSLSRAVERMAYQDLVGEEGKAKLKLLIRRDLNEVLTKGKIRRVFFKTLVLNPE